MSVKFLKTVEWISAAPGSLVPGKVRFIDQTRLPHELVYIETDDADEVWHAIKELKVRGAPAIGICAAMGLIGSVQHSCAADAEAFISELKLKAEYLATSRPTAVNLFWAINRIVECALQNNDMRVDALITRLAKEACKIRDEDARMCRQIGEHGVTLLPEGSSVLTHCNAGSLATAEFGTALAPVYIALEKGMSVKVFADETRPLLQGARLTAWELNQAGADVTLICDNMAASLMREGRISCVMVGADRIAANGDAANKIGTYGVAVLARHHGIPFYVLAPSSTFDLSISGGDMIPIEQRGSEEVCGFHGVRTAPNGVKVVNPAFDVTPAELITGIVCERGILKPDYRRSIAGMLSSTYIS